MAEYIEYHPLKFWLNPASIAEIVAHIQSYLVDNPINSTTEIETIIHDYLIAHPELIGGVDSVNGQTGEVVLTADNISAGENVTIKDVLDSLQDQIDDIVASIPSDYQQLINDVSDLKSVATKIPDVEVMRNALTINGSSNVMSEILTLGDLGDRSGKPYLPTFVSRVFTEPYLRFSFDVKITCPNTYYFRVYFYNDGVFDRLLSWTRNLTIPAYQQFRIVMRNYPEDTSITADPATFANNLSFSVVSSAGDQTYRGVKVNLAPDLTKQNNCSIQLWKDFTNTDDAWKLYDAQSMDIYDGKMFIFTSDGVANVLDMESKEIIATFATDSSVHFNSVQFSNVFYSANDKYPLLFVVYTPYVNVYRLTESNSVFNLSFINRINISFQQYGGSMSIDSGLRLLNIALYKNGEYSVYSDNPCAFYSFRLPSDADILSGTEIELTYADVIAETETDHATLQDAKAKNGIVYQGVANDSETNPKQFVWCINNKNSSLQTIIRLLVNLEVEGIAIDGSTMYIAQRRGTNSGNTNPLKIYSVTF